MFENNVKHIEEKEMGLNAEVFEDNNNEEDYNRSVEIETNTTKIFISYK